MTLSEKIRTLLKLRNYTSAKLGKAANISRSTMSRIMRDHIPSDDTLIQIATVMEVSPGYLRRDYTLPEWLTEEDILTLADLRNLPYLRFILEAAEKGLTPEDLKNIIKAISYTPNQGELG